MGKNSRPSFQKRAKEKARQDRRKEKDARRLETKERRANALPRTGAAAFLVTSSVAPVRRQSGQRPVSSSQWLCTVKPVCARADRASVPMAHPENSTVRRQRSQVTW